jgi:hypothetical protein
MGSESARGSPSLGQMRGTTSHVVPANHMSGVAEPAIVDGAYIAKGLWR